MSLTPTEQEILQKHLAKFLISEVFNTISEEDILKVSAPGVWTHKGRKLTDGQIKALKAEAKVFHESALWLILKSELLYLAQDRGYVKSKTEADQIAGKMLQYLTDIVDSKLKRMQDN